MSSLFKTLSNEDLKFEKMSGQPQQPPKMTGVKIAVFFSFLLSVLALAGAGLLKNALEAERGQREMLEASHTQLQQKSQAFEKSAAQYRSEVEKMRSELRVYTQEKEDLQKQLKQSRSQMAQLEHKIKSIQEKNQTAEEALAGASQAEQAAAGPAAKDAASAPSPKPVPAKPPQVLTVNRKFNFVVANIGLQQKLKIGDVLQVLRKGKPVARLQVEKLYESFCAASITQEPKDAPIQEGDLVSPG